MRERQLVWRNAEWTETIEAGRRRQQQLVGTYGTLLALDGRSGLGELGHALDRLGSKDTKSARAWCLRQRVVGSARAGAAVC